MSRPFPIISCPDAESKRRVARALEVAGLRWVGGAVGSSDFEDDGYVGIHLSDIMGDRAYWRFYYPNETDSSLANGQMTRVNSAAHFIRYTKSLIRS